MILFICNLLFSKILHTFVVMVPTTLPIEQRTRVGLLLFIRMRYSKQPLDYLDIRRTRQTLWSAVQMLTQKLCCQTIHDCPKVVPLHYESE